MLPVLKGTRPKRELNTHATSLVDQSPNFHGPFTPKVNTSISFRKSGQDAS